MVIPEQARGRAQGEEECSRTLALTTPHAPPNTTHPYMSLPAPAHSDMWPPNNVSGHKCAERYQATGVQVGPVKVSPPVTTARPPALGP